MLKLTIIGLAVVIAAVGLGVEADRDVAEPPEPEALDANIAADEAEFVEADTDEDSSTRVRLCLGPARITFGGHPSARVAFGGEGCARDSASILGVRLLPSNPAAPKPETHSSLML